MNRASSWARNILKVEKMSKSCNVLVDISVWDGMWEERVAFFSLNAGLTEHCQVQGLVRTLCDMYVMSHG